MNSPSDELAVGVENLSVHLGGARILDSVSFAVRRGRITGLLGPSGGGKTTLMRALAGVQRHTGTATVLGLPAGDRRLRDRVGYVTQSRSVYADLTARQNVAYFAALYGRPARTVAETLATVDLADKADARVRDLSGGQRGRVSLACALVAEPKLLLLDEPTVGLDPVLRVALWERFRDLSEGGTTLLISSHVMDEADRCHDILLLRAGRVVGSGTPVEFHERTGHRNMEDAFLAVIADADDTGSAA
ncbi:ABC transporter ATP-binding protein [Dietzia sp. 179-F 9C3 NHS]|uniref:ABC transporter ATP-binding protein n=1 Tax=Dietzia sp. 179-F 9C3 NHS TaxID=3374295 RepID=UPI00387A2249